MLWSRWECDDYVQFETQTHASQAKYFKPIPHLDIVWNQEYKFSQASSKLDLKSSPKFRPKLSTVYSLTAMKYS